MGRTRPQADGDWVLDFHAVRDCGVSALDRAGLSEGLSWKLARASHRASLARGTHRESPCAGRQEHPRCPAADVAEKRGERLTTVRSGVLTPDRRVRYSQGPG
jgi:hypothetical protein